MTVAVLTSSLEDSLEDSELLSGITDGVSEEDSDEDGGVLEAAVQLAKVSKADTERMSNAGFFMSFPFLLSRGYLA